MKKYSINFLTESFFNDHSRTKYPEIERKRNRPYMFIALRIEEYNELRKKYFHVIAKFKKYVKGYITLSRNKVDMESNYKYRYSTLRYYHKELGIK